jgi:hypothetical protein
MRDLSTHSLRCPENQAGDPDVPIMLNLGPGEEAVAGDSVRIHGFVMDAACDPVADYRRTQSLTPGSTSVLPVWDGRDDQGNLVRTGEYYVNLELEWKDGSRDTTYHKVGYVRYNCPGVVR